MPLSFVNKILDLELNLDIHREDALKEVFKHFETTFKEYINQHRTPFPTIYLVAFVDGKQITKYYDGADLYYPSSPQLLFGTEKKKEKIKKIACIRAFSHLTSSQQLTVTSALNDWFEKSEEEKLIKNIGLVHVNGAKVHFEKDTNLKMEVAVRGSDTKKEFKKLVSIISKHAAKELLDGSVEFNFDEEQTKRVINSIAIDVKDQETSFKFLAPLLHAYSSISGFNHIYYLPSAKLRENGQLESLGFIVVSCNTKLSFDETNLLKVAGGLLLANIGLIESNFQTKKAIHKPHIREIDYNPEYLYQIASKIEARELDKDIMIRYFEKNIVQAMSRLKRINHTAKNEKKVKQLAELENHFSILLEKINAEVLKNSNLKDELLQFNNLLDTKPKLNDSAPLRHPIQFILENSDWTYYDQFISFNESRVRNLDENFHEQFFKPLITSINEKADKNKLAGAIDGLQTQTTKLLINGVDSFDTFRNDGNLIALFTKNDWELINRIILENYCLRAHGKEEDYYSIITLNHTAKQIEFKMQDQPLTEESKIGLLTSLNSGFREYKLSHLKSIICGKYNSGITFLSVNSDRSILSLSSLTDKAKWEATKNYSDCSNGFYYILKF